MDGSDPAFYWDTNSLAFPMSIRSYTALYHLALLKQFMKRLFFF